MAELLNIPIPAIPDNYYSNSDVSSISNSLSQIKGLLGPFILLSSTLIKIPKSLITSIIFIESGGRNIPANSAGAIGYMEITAPTAYDTIRYFSYNGYLSQGIKAMIESKLPAINLTMKGNQFPFWPSSMGVNQLRSALTDPEFNIFVGSMYIRVCLDQTVTGGNARIDKAIVFYNFGMYNSFYSTSGWKDSTVNDLYLNDNLPDETKNYILKMIGTNGTLDILLNNKS